MANYSDNSKLYDSIQDLSTKSDDYNSVLKLLWNKVDPINNTNNNEIRPLPSSISNLDNLPDGNWYLPDSDINDYDTIMSQQTYNTGKIKLQIILFGHDGNECIRSFINNKWNTWQAMTTGYPIIFTKNINLAPQTNYSGNSTVNMFTIPVIKGKEYYFSMYVANGNGDYFITTNRSINGWMHIGPNISKDHNYSSSAGIWGAYPGEHYVCKWTADSTYNMPIGIFRDGGGNVDSASHICVTQSNKYIPYEHAISYQYDPFATP